MKKKRKSKAKGSVEKERYLKALGVIYSKDLAARATSWELEFKAKLEELGISFIFQHPIVCEKNYLYILDFFLPDYNIAFELDGAHHYQKDKVKADAARTRRVSVLGIKVKRILNRNVQHVTLPMLEAYLKAYKC
jgi:very-short-patch-repair endonuclease